MASLAGKVVLITGGSGGLGRAFTEKFLKAGCKVLMCDINQEEGNKSVEYLSCEFGADNIKFTVCDVTSDESFKGAFKFCKDSFGRVDVLINNAGLGNEKDLLSTINVNLMGTIRGTELAMRFMGEDKGHNGGVVVNIASIAGLKNLPFGPYYSTTKAGIIQFTRVIGHPFHLNYSGVLVQCLCPSLVKTPFIQVAEGKSYNEKTEAAIKNLFGKVPLLEVEEVADSLFSLIESKKPGAVMVLEKGKEAYYVDPSISL